MSTLGTFSAESIDRLIAAGQVTVAGDTAGQVQPASLDLTLGEEAYALPGSLLPIGAESVRDLVRQYARRKIDLRQAEVFVRGEVYLVLLRESLKLGPEVAAYANNKSSTGRIDLQTRLLTDQTPRYDRVRRGYAGELWLEIIPKSFDVVLHAGDSLNQMIFYEERKLLDAAALERLHAYSPLLFTPDGAAMSPKTTHDALLMTLDLQQEIVGYRAKKSLRPLDLRNLRGHEPSDYFEPILRPRDGALFLSQEAFYILSTYEYVSVPTEFAVEMLPYDTSAGEFRAHYAGFFDPGFGFGLKGEGRGTPAVLEVRPYEDDLIIRHRQPVCKMVYERLDRVPGRVYGADMGSHYAHQRGPRLSKHFRMPD